MLPGPPSKTLVSDTWLTAAAGFDCFNLINPDFSPTDIDFPNGLITAKLDLSSTKTPERMSRAIQSGFRVITFQVYLSGVFERSMKLGRDWDREDLNFRQAIIGDQEEIVRLAEGSFSLDRFHSDPRLPKRTGDKIKGAWVESFFRNERGNSLTVAEISGAICGFLLTQESNDEILIDLIAVDRRFQGQGIASELLGHQVGMKDLNRLRISAGTQLSNGSSLRLYKACGLREAKHEVVLHRVEGI